MEMLIGQLDPPSSQVHFWKTHTGAELDLLIPERRIGFEIKRTTKPKVTPSIRSALRDLDLDQLIIVHAGSESYPLASNVRAVAASRLEADLQS